MGLHPTTTMDFGGGSSARPCRPGVAQHLALGGAGEVGRHSRRAIRAKVDQRQHQLAVGSARRADLPCRQLDVACAERGRLRCQGLVESQLTVERSRWDTVLGVIERPLKIMRSLINTAFCLGFFQPASPAHWWRGCQLVAAFIWPAPPEPPTGERAPPLWACGSARRGE
jgi:hypothetical protein